MGCGGGVGCGGEWGVGGGVGGVGVGGLSPDHSLTLVILLRLHKTAQLLKEMTHSHTINRHYIYPMATGISKEMHYLMWLWPFQVSYLLL